MLLVTYTEKNAYDEMYMYSTWRGMLYNIFIIDQASSVKMAGCQPRSLFASLDIDFASVLGSTGFASHSPGIV